MSVNAPNDELGWKAVDFKLLSIDDKYYSLSDLKGKKGTVIAFICNHCPYVIKIANNLAFEANELRKLEVSTIAIMSNDVLTYPQDSFENMKLFAKKYNFTFQYLYDESQEVAHAYGAKRTPEFFLFNSDNTLVYRGRMDDSPRDPSQVSTSELKDAIDAMLDGRSPDISETESIGCSVKWKA